MSECRENFYIIVKKQNYRVYATCTEGTSGILRPPFAFTLLGPGILLTAVHVANTVLVSAAVVILISAHCVVSADYFGICSLTFHNPRQDTVHSSYTVYLFVVLFL